MAQNSTAQQVDNTTALLGSAATYLTPGISIGSADGQGGQTNTGVPTNGYSKFRVGVFADQAGTLNIQQSINQGTTWRTFDTVAVVAGTPSRLEAALVWPNVRVQYVNGATGQGTFELSSELVATT